MLVYERPVEIWRDFVPNDAVLAVATTELRALGEDGKRQLSHYASTPTAFTPYMATQLEQAIVFRLCAKARASRAAAAARRGSASLVACALHATMQTWPSGSRPRG